MRRPGSDALALGERLRRARGHHAGERPAGERQRAVVGAGGEHDGAGVHAAVRRQQHARLRRGPHGGAAQDRDAGRAEVAERRARRGRHGRGHRVAELGERRAARSGRRARRTRRSAARWRRRAARTRQRPSPRARHRPRQRQRGRYKVLPDGAQRPPASPRSPEQPKPPPAARPPACVASSMDDLLQLAIQIVLRHAVRPAAQQGPAAADQHHRGRGADGVELPHVEAGVDARPGSSRRGRTTTASACPGCLAPRCRRSSPRRRSPWPARPATAAGWRSGCTTRRRRRRPAAATSTAPRR